VWFSLLFDLEGAGDPVVCQVLEVDRYDVKVRIAAQEGREVWIRKAVIAATEIRS
jgi:hypothetical protein